MNLLGMPRAIPSGVLHAFSAPRGQAPLRRALASDAASRTGVGCTWSVRTPRPQHTERAGPSVAASVCQLWCTAKLGI
jgi:hypothetical protein